mmetsp:Transcript_8282/g.21234  ORF Transcript_8282/g.21234 Transcript_8282/m.21234 type:complete len:217 (+) Transcript_8282:920-1570(+)
MLLVTRQTASRISFDTGSELSGLSSSTASGPPFATLLGRPSSSSVEKFAVGATQIRPLHPRIIDTPVSSSAWKWCFWRLIRLGATGTSVPPFSLPYLLLRVCSATEPSALNACTSALIKSPSRKIDRMLSSSSAVRRRCRPPGRLTAESISCACCRALMSTRHRFPAISVILPTTTSPRSAEYLDLRARTETSLFTRSTTPHTVAMSVSAPSRWMI